MGIIADFLKKIHASFQKLLRGVGNHDFTSIPVVLFGLIGCNIHLNAYEAASQDGLHVLQRNENARRRVAERLQFMNAL